MSSRATERVRRTCAVSTRRASEVAARRARQRSTTCPRRSSRTDHKGPTYRMTPLPPEPTRVSPARRGGARLAEVTTGETERDGLFRADREHWRRWRALASLWPIRRHTSVRCYCASPTTHDAQSKTAGEDDDDEDELTLMLAAAGSQRTSHARRRRRTRLVVLARSVRGRDPIAHVLALSISRWPRSTGCVLEAIQPEPTTSNCRRVRVVRRRAASAKATKHH